MRYPLFAVSSTGRSVNVSRERRVNLFCEVRESPDKAQLVFYGTPGKVQFCDFGDTPIRGKWAFGDYLYAVHLGVLYEIDTNGTATNRGSLGTTAGRVSMADNGTQLMIVDGTDGYIYNQSTHAFTTIASAFFANPTTCWWQDGYFLASFADSGRFQISASYDGTTWAALDFANAESAPDDLVAGVSHNSQVVLFGQSTAEFWTNTGAQDFPYSRVQGSTINWGLAARWSIGTIGDDLVYLAKNKRGEVQVVRLVGYQVQVISTPDMSTAINAYSTTSDASAFSYIKGGHDFYQINFPTAGKSWVFDGLTGIWSELQSGTDGERDLGECAAQFNSKTYVSDYATGKIYSLDLDTYTDNGATIVRELASRHVFSETQLKVYRVWLDIETGVGNAADPDPQVMLSVSKDGGHTFGTERLMAMGATGQHARRCYLNRLGQSYDWVFRFRISSPVKVVIMGGWLSTESNSKDNFIAPVPRQAA